MLPLFCFATRIFVTVFRISPMPFHAVSEIPIQITQLISQWLVFTVVMVIGQSVP